MAILESIAAATAAVNSTFDDFISSSRSGREAAGLVGEVGKFLSAEEDIKKALQKKKNSPLTAIAGGEEGDWEEFQALEDLRDMRRQLESDIRLYGKPGQWDRWIQWQNEARKQRQAARKAAELAHAKRMEQMQIAAGIILAITVTVLGVYYLGVYLDRW